MTDQPKIVALILAAGSSARMGTLKPLLPLGQSTLLQVAVEKFSLAGIDDVRVVVGYRAEEITPLLAQSKTTHILNSHYQRGMFSSILAGVDSFEDHVEAFFVLPADIPLVKPETIKILVEVFKRNRPLVAYPRILGRRGHPPLVSLACLSKRPSWDHPGGLRAFLGSFDQQAEDVDVIDEGVLLDCDTPEEYQRVLSRFMSKNIPSIMECRAILLKHRVPQATVAHCHMVAELAKTLAIQLNQSGADLNPDLTEAAGLLHDLAKGQPNHSWTGARIINELGCEQVARIIAWHTDLPEPPGSLKEMELVYLADKMVKGNQLAPLEKRFKQAREQFADQPEILRSVERRFQHAETIKKLIERALQKPLDGVIKNVEKVFGTLL